MKTPAALLLLLVLVPACSRAPRSPVLVRVNGEAVTRAQLDAERMFLGPSAPDDADLLEDLIDQTLILQEGRLRGVQLDAAARREAEERARGGTDAALLEASLKARGLDPLAWRERIHRAALIEAVLRREVRAHVRISPQELQDHYWENLPRYRYPERQVLRQIFTRRKADAEKALRELELGGDFAEVARRRGEGPEAAAGGLLDALALRQLPADLARAVAKLKPGMRTALLASPWGWHILRLERRLPALNKSLEQALPQAQAALLVDKEQDLYRAWLAGLRERARIERVQAPASGPRPEASLPRKG